MIEWINITKRLPRDSQLILAYFENPATDHAQVLTCYGEVANDPDNAVTHWAAIQTPEHAVMFPPTRGKSND